MTRRGSVLALVLVLIPILAMVLFAVAQMLVVNQVACRQLEFGGKARLLARAGLATCLARVRDEPAFADGVNGTIDDGTFSVVLENRYRQDTGTATCPANAILMTATGTVNGYSATLSSLVAVPPYNYAVASTGAVNASGGMILGSVASDAVDVKLEDLLPAEMMTGATSSSALVIGGNSTIVGKAKSAGGSDVASSVDLSRGEVLNGQTVDEVPRIPLSDFDTSAAQVLAGGNFTEPQKLSGLLSWTGTNLTFAQGLELNGATIRVTGNVVINGGVRGAGALLVDGNVTIVNGTTDLHAENQVAIVASGGVNVTGPGYFQGLLSAGGESGLTLRDVTVLGTVLNSGKTTSGEGAPMTVSNSTVVRTGKGVEYEQSVAINDEPDPLVGMRLHKPLPLSAFYDAAAGRWITDNTRANASQENPYGLSPVELVLLPFLEFKVNGTWYPTLEDATANGFSRSDLRREALSAASQVLPQLPSASAPPPSANKAKLDLSRYLKASQRLRVVWIQPG